MMESWFILVPFALTSAAALWLGRRPRGVRASLGAAVAKALETVGLTVVFYLANVAAGALVTSTARALRVAFISIYLSTDVVLLVLSLFQALVFQRWREQATASD
jgi:hypothetical protein